MAARRRNVAPLAISAILGFPLFFASLLAVSLAIERPHRFQWQGAKGRLIEIDHQPTGTTEAKIWALAFVVPAILVAIGAAATRWRRGGVYLVAASGVALSLALPHRVDRWVAHHTKRFPPGMDLIADVSPSSTIARGEWEQSAKEAILSLTHYTIGIALGVAAVMAFLKYRRRFGRRVPPVGPPPPVVTGGPQTSPVIGAEPPSLA